MKPHLPALLALSLVAASSAVADTIDTNRPGFTFTTGVLERGEWQLETGLSQDRVNSSERTLNVGGGEFRFGLSGNLEGFINSIAWNTTDSDGGDFNGITDWGAGLKTRISRPDATTQMALLFQVIVPVGDDAYSSDRWDPSAAFIWHYQGAFQLAGTARVTDLSEGYVLDNSFKAPFSLGGPNSAFVEWEANLPEVGDDSHYLTLGYQYLIRDNMQFDINGSAGLNDDASDYRFGIGFSFRP